ncbi:MAG: hypothetical protein AAFP77_22835 [Bacteroidota bacterium]
MIRFFRRIRQGFLREGAFSKYLLYAVGEIAFKEKSSSIYFNPVITASVCFWIRLVFQER